MLERSTPSYGITAPKLINSVYKLLNSREGHPRKGTTAPLSIAGLVLFVSSHFHYTGGGGN